MDDDQFLYRNREGCEFDVSPEQREEMARELDAWSSDRDEPPFSHTLSNAYLYEYVRMNGIPFSRFRTYTLEEMDAVSEDAFWCMFPSEKFSFAVSDEQRAAMIEARDQWLGTYDDRATAGASEELSNERLYEELREAGVPFDRNPSEAPSFA